MRRQKPPCCEPRAPGAAARLRRRCEVHCFVDLDLKETFSATPWNLARLCDWAVRIDRDGKGEPGEAAAAGGGSHEPADSCACAEVET